MTLQEAIELLAQWHKDLQHDKLPRYHNALRLGIEALKEVGYYRENPISYVLKLLPGETKEV